MRYQAHNLPEAASVAFSAARQRDPQEFRWMYLGAISEELAGADPMLVVARFDEALGAGYEYGSLHLRKAQTLGRAGELDRALASYQKALSLVPDMHMARRGLGQIKLQMGQYEDAIVDLEAVYSVAPDDRPTIAALAQCLAAQGSDPQRAGRLAEMIATTQETLHLPDPIYMEVEARVVSASALVTKARQLMSQGRWEEAAVHLREAIQSEPSSATPVADLALCHASLGQSAQAQQIWERALRIDSDLVGAHSGLAVLAMNEGRWSEALEGFDRAVTLDPTRALNHLRQGHCLIMLGDHDLAQQSLVNALKEASNKATVWRQWGEVHLSCRQPGEARLAFEESLRHDPDQAQAWFGLGQACEASGAGRDAIAAYRRSATIAPNGPAARRLQQLQ